MNTTNAHIFYVILVLVAFNMASCHPFFFRVQAHHILCCFVEGHSIYIGTTSIYLPYAIFSEDKLTTIKIVAIDPAAVRTFAGENLYQHLSGTDTRHHDTTSAAGAQTRRANGNKR